MELRPGTGGECQIHLRGSRGEISADALHDLSGGIRRAEYGHARAFYFHTRILPFTFVVSFGILFSMIAQKLKIYKKIVACIWYRTVRAAIFDNKLTENNNDFYYCRI